MKPLNKQTACKTVRPERIIQFGYKLRMEQFEQFINWFIIGE